MRKSLAFIIAASLFLLSGCAVETPELPELPKLERGIAAVDTPETTPPEPSAEPSPKAETPVAVVAVEWKEAEAETEAETREPEQRATEDMTVAAISLFEPVIVSSPAEAEAPAPTEVPMVIEFAPAPEVEQKPTATPEPTAVPTPEPSPEPKADFNIGCWISYAQSVAVGKGLNLDNSAVDCWDNPITANPDCIYLERDINSRLNRYAGDEEITDVWIWYECVGPNSYLIYIGYA